MTRVRRIAALAAASAALCVFLSGCAKRKRAPRMPAVPKAGSVETGIASWYGHPYHGRRAANGEVYDMDKLTAAHRTLPFGARVMVENQTNGRSVEVRITDRGPFIDGRIIDLSRAAARRIEMIGPGTALVRVIILGYGPAQGAPAFAVQVGAFESRRRADQLREQLELRHAPVRVIRRDGPAPVWRVLVGDKATQVEAEALASALKRNAPGAFVVRIDP
ncbi:MAG: septal ring lytic transglycosylase RlpA family lipoprotein [Candidatus Solibacter sp.]|nr:septal ring lytic transglycosylase RlpA family lipoprotein [Candidatus Solibacter sp.]